MTTLNVFQTGELNVTKDIDWTRWTDKLADEYKNRKTNVQVIEKVRLALGSIVNFK